MHQGGEGRVEDGFGHHDGAVLIHVDQQPLEDQLVEHLPLGGLGLAVQLLGSRQQRQSQAQPLSHDVLFGAGRRDQALGRHQFVLHGGLSGLEVSDWDGVGQVGVDQLLFLPLQVSHSALLASQQPFIAGLKGSELGIDHLTDPMSQLRCEAHPIPHLDDRGVHPFGWQVGQVAARHLAVPAQAEEVGVLAAPASALAVAHPLTTAGAVQAALQVLLTFPGPIPGQPAVGQHGLHS